MKSADCPEVPGGGTGGFGQGAGDRARRGERRGEPDGPGESARLRGFQALQWIILAAVSVLVFAISQWQAEAWNRRLTIEALHRAGAVTAASYGMLLQSEIEKQRLVPFILASDPDVIQALSAQPSAATSPALSLAAARTALDRRFALLDGGTTAPLIALLDANGMVVATSNWNQPTSVLGDNFAFRPYYSQARATGTGEFFAFGLNTHWPVLFLAQRVEANGQFLGVVVVQVEFHQLEDALGHSRAKVFVVNSNGVVLLTGVPAWQFRTITPLSQKLRASLRARAQFDAVPLPFTAVNDGQLLTVGRQHFVTITAQVPSTDWTVYLLVPLDKALGLGEYQVRLSAILFTALILGLAFIIRIRFYHRSVVKAQTDELKRLAVTDPLTQLLNRRAFENILDQEWRRAHRTGVSLAIIMVDVDYFKFYNDFYGHPAGDECLRAISSVLRDSVKRAGDTVARYGGEEFILLLPNTDANGAILVAETTLKATRALDIKHKKSPIAGSVTLSFGVAPLAASNDDSPAFLISRADTALYEAKRAGRNRIVCNMRDVTMASPD